MAHFAQLDENNIVTQVIVVSNDDAPDEATGVAFCKTIYGSDTNWKQTSYNSHADTPYVFNESQARYYNPTSPPQKGMVWSTTEHDWVVPPKPSADQVITSDSVKHLIWKEASAEAGYMWLFPVTYPIADDPDFELYEWSDSAYEADNTKGWVLR